MDYTLIGVAGAILIAFAWLPQVAETIKKKRSEISLEFVVISLVATILLLVYSISLADWVFIFVNGFILFQISISLYYKLFVEKKAKKK